MPLLAFLACVASVLASSPANGASSGSTTVGVTVLSSTELTACSSGPATDFGVVLPGTTAVTSIDCTIGFGSTNDSSMLRLSQADQLGVGMFAYTDGTLDPNWDASVAGNGQFTVAGSAPPDLYDNRPDIQLQPTTGKVVAAYHDASDYLDVVRFEDDGDLDPTFATAGRYTWDSANFNSLSRIGMGPDGSIFVASYDGWSPYDVNVLKLTPSGAPDPTFDGPSGTGNGIVSFANPGFVHVTGVLVMPDGDLVVYGNANDGNYIGAVMRLNPTGSIDTAFGGGDGYDEYDDLGTHTHFDSAAAQPDGKVVFAGHEWAGGIDTIVARILPNGTLDATFVGPGAGLAVPGLFGISNNAVTDSANSIAVAPDGDILVAGYGNSGGTNIFTARLNGADGSLDTVWDGPAGTGNGQFIFSASAGEDEAYEVLVTPGGEVFLAGVSSPGGMGLESLIVKLRADGSLDPAFDGPTGSGNGAVTIPGTANDEVMMHASFGADGDILMAGVTDAATDLVRVVRFNGHPLADYDDDDILPADTNWTEGTAGFFGVCLRSFTGTAATATWSANATCPQDDTGTHWRAIPLATGPSKVGQLGGPATDGVATLQFGMKVPLTQRPGAYVAPISVEVIAPAV